jgi:hypothetical protein
VVAAVLAGEGETAERAAKNLLLASYRSVKDVLPAAPG